MAESLLAFLRDDLREALAGGFQRTPAVSPDGGLWLARWALVSAFVGLTLFLFCGYHGGFSRLNVVADQLHDLLWLRITMLGDERVAFALTLFFSRRYPRVFWSLVAAALLGTAFTHSFKPLFAALRPPAVLESGTFNLIGPDLRKSSFPSGHTVTVTILSGVWAYYLRASWCRLLLILVAVAVGLSRVALGVHWPIDVAAGMTVGLTAAWLGVAVARRGEALGMNPSNHAVLVTLAVAMAVSLLLSDGGYPETADMQHLFALAALGYAAFAYLIRPIRRRRASRAKTGEG